MQTILNTKRTGAAVIINVVEAPTIIQAVMQRDALNLHAPSSAEVETSD